MLKKIFLNIPLRMVSKIYRFFYSEINELKESKNKRIEYLSESYKEIGIKEDRDKIIQRLNICLKSLGLPSYDEDNGMYSEHLVIFTALSISALKPKKILELGTYLGVTSLILSRLFPESLITTIDLKDNDPIFKNSYKREQKFSEFIKKRNQFLKKAKNVNFVQSNSLFLTVNSNFKNQDLIWVDGAHGYPVVASDITNCLGNLNKKGILMCDDVWKKLNKSDKMYSSIASFETLSAFKEAKIIDTTFFRKRIGKKYNGNYKYISFSKLKN
mgnify:CR=1 FL=1